MKYSISFTYLNPEFDQKLADEQFEGHESEHNIRNVWEDEIEIKGDVSDFKIVHKQNYPLQAEVNGEIQTQEIPNMTLFVFQSDLGETVLAASTKLIKETDIKTITPEEKIVYVYLKGKNEPFSPFAGLYVKEGDE
jgi:hypothetical protein